jgi:cytochrome c oxidase subunit 2
MVDLVEGANATMLVLKRFIAIAVAAVAVLTFGDMALADIGQPRPWQLGMPEPVTSVMSSVNGFHTFLLWLITAIVLFVLALLVAVIVKYNAGSNPVPSRTTHNTLIEVVWTVVPVLILVMIAIPSFRLLFHQLEIPKADVTIKATGKQWFWTYTYPDHGNFEFDSLIAQDKQPRLLAVDNEVVVPVNKVVRVLVTGADVIHAWAVPNFGVLMDATPGRVNETWFKAEREGIYYGQCRELCGKDHAYMPIAVRVVSDQEFATWVAQAKQKFARDDRPAMTTVAAAAAESASE